MYVAVRADDGAIIIIDSKFAETDSQVRWLTQPAFSGDNPKIAALALQGWKRYAHIPDPTLMDKFWARYHTLRHHMLWNSPKLTAFVFNIRRYGIVI